MMELKDMYRQATGKKWWVNPVCHGERGFCSDEYMEWLEAHFADLTQKVEELEKEKKEQWEAFNKFGNKKLDEIADLTKQIEDLKELAEEKENKLEIVRGIVYRLFQAYPIMKTGMDEETLGIFESFKPSNSTTRRGLTEKNKAKK